MKVIKGNTLKKQMEHVDRILKSYSRKLHKTVTGIITPVPVSNYSESSGIILRYMFPVNGKITIGGLYVEEMPKSGIDIKATIFSGPLHDSKSIFSKKQATAIMPDFEVFPGTRLMIRVLPVDVNEVASKIWIALLWTPKVKDSEIKQFLIDDLEKVGNNVLSEGT